MTITPPDTEPVVVSASPLDDQLMSALRDLLKVIGASLVAKGLIDATWVEPSIGLIMVVGPVVWSQLVVRLKHAKLFAVAADPRVPDSVARVAK